MSTLQQKLMSVGCDNKLERSVGRKKLVSVEVEANAFSRCLKRRIAVDDILEHNLKKNSKNINKFFSYHCFKKKLYFFF